MKFPIEYPKVSVIVLNFNGKEYLKNCFESLKNQTYPNYEVIMVDNASTDESVEYVKKGFPWVRVFQNKENLGFAGGNNAGIKQATGNLIALINNDAVADKKWLEELVKVITVSPKIGIVGGKIYYSDPPDRCWFAGGNFYLPFGRGAQIQEKKDRVKEVDWITGCAILFRGKVIEKIGLLDSGYFIYFEDMDFCLQAKRSEYKIIYTPEAVVWHGEAGTTKRFGSKKLYYEYQSKFRFILKNLSLAQIISALMFQLIFVTFYNYVILRNENFLEKAKALIWNLKHLRETLEARRSSELRRKTAEK